MATKTVATSIFKAAAKRSGKKPSEINGWSNRYFTDGPLNYQQLCRLEDNYIYLMHQQIKERDEIIRKFRSKYGNIF